MGESSDVVPVLANVPRKASKERVRNPDTDDDSVSRMVGESSKKDDSIFPEDAEPVDPGEMSDGKPMREPKEIVQEPSHPTSDKEKYLTPYSALTAPDVTPMSTQPIDPSDVPGTPSPERFSAADLERATEIGGQEQPNDNAARAMDVLLGKNRAAKPATQPGDFEQAGAVTSEMAASMVGVNTIVIQEEAASKAASALVPAVDGGNGMPPPPPPSDGAKVYSAFRRFAG
jgi:hypothetical protein